MSLPYNDTKHALRICFPVWLLIYLTLLFDSRSVSSSVSFSVFFNFFDSSCSVFHSLFHSMCVVLRQLRKLLFFNGFRRVFSSVFSSLLKQGDYTLPFGREKLHRHLIRPSPFPLLLPLTPPAPTPRLDPIIINILFFFFPVFRSLQPARCSCPGVLRLPPV